MNLLKLNNNNISHYLNPLNINNQLLNPISPILNPEKMDLENQLQLQQEGDEKSENNKIDINKILE